MYLCVQKRRVNKPSRSDDDSSLSTGSRQIVSLAFTYIQFLVTIYSKGSFVNTQQHSSCLSSYDLVLLLYEIKLVLTVYYLTNLRHYRTLIGSSKALSDLKCRKSALACSKFGGAMLLFGSCGVPFSAFDTDVWVMGKTSGP